MDCQMIRLLKKKIIVMLNINYDLNIQIFKYSNIQIFKYSNVQIFELFNTIESTFKINLS